MQGQVFLRAGKEGAWADIFTFRNYFTNSSSAAGRSRHLVHPAADDVFVKLLYSLRNCFMHLKKKYFLLPL